MGEKVFWILDGCGSEGIGEEFQVQCTCGIYIRFYDFPFDESYIFLYSTFLFPQFVTFEEAIMMSTLHFAICIHGWHYRHNIWLRCDQTEI